jgi:hypothetical protein
MTRVLNYQTVSGDVKCTNFSNYFNVSGLVLVQVGPSALINALGHCDLVRSFVTLMLVEIALIEYFVANF